MSSLPYRPEGILMRMMPPQSFLFAPRSRFAVDAPPLRRALRAGFAVRFGLLQLQSRSP